MKFFNYKILVFSIFILLLLPQINLGGVCSSSVCGGCLSHYYQRCVGNYLYWFDSCGNQEEWQYCPGGCVNNICYSSPTFPVSQCNPHAYKLCVGNRVYWFDSCGNQQELFQDCSSVNLTCRYGQCVMTQSNPSYNPYFKVACYQNNLYWFDNFGVKTGLYKSCADSNSCTQDGCTEGKCFNILKCDGSTCPRGSQSYNVYCAKKSCGDGVCDKASGEDSTNCPFDCKTQENFFDLIAFNFLAKSDSSVNWEKSIKAGENEELQFLVFIGNNSDSQVEKAKIIIEAFPEVLFSPKILIDNTEIAGDLTSGIEIGPFSPRSGKSIIFSGKIQNIQSQETKEIKAILRIDEKEKRDSLQITYIPPQVAGASINQFPLESPSFIDNLLNFVKRWYVWIIIGFILVFLFIAVYRRLSLE